VKHESGEGEGEFIKKFMYYNRYEEKHEVWGSVCIDKFALNDYGAKVVCKRLGLPVGRNI